jgi:hypothetical protein
MIGGSPSTRHRSGTTARCDRSAETAEAILRFHKQRENAASLRTTPKKQQMNTLAVLIDLQG